MKRYIFIFFIFWNFVLNAQNKGDHSEKELIQLIQKWDKLHNTCDFKNLLNLYADQVCLYSNNCPKNQVVENKKIFIKKYPDFSQKIDLKDIFFMEINKSKYKAVFTKTTIFNGKKSVVQAILEFKKMNNGWKINYESDNVTEDNRPTKCITVALKILESSPEFIKITDGLAERIIKNGGTSYGYRIEGSPNPKEDEADDYSKNYEFSLHESYPDRAPVIAIYAFDPIRKKLFQYDESEGEYSIPLTFDEKWLKKFEKICK
jgi:ketosteroid isomerase-like protein